MPGYDPSAYVGMAEEVLKTSRKNLAGVKGRLDADVQTIVMNDPRYEDMMDPFPDRLHKNGRT